MKETRFDQIRSEHEHRVESVGRAEADRELYRALARVEGELDDLKSRILSMVQITDRRGIFLPPYQQSTKPLPAPPRVEEPPTPKLTEKP